MTYTAMDITVIITCYREGELLRRAMFSCLRQEWIFIAIAFVCPLSIHVYLFRSIE
jgi:hypothetical protein